MKSSIRAVAFIGLCYTGFGWANNNYPLEFADFFEERLETIEVVVAGETRSQTIDGLVSYETFRLRDESRNVEVLTSYLKSLRLTDTAVEEITIQLLNGVSANPGCEGALSKCIPQRAPNAAEFVFDFDTQQLKVFVGGDMLSRQADDAEYYSSARVDNALINWSDLYFYVDGDGNDSLTWTNNFTLGLPLGFLSVETQYQHNERHLELYQALYDVEIESTRAIIGYQSRNAVAFNSTDFLNYSANYAGLGLSIGSSQNLLKGQAQAQKRIYFFAPQAAQLEVYQGERLLLNRVVSQGQQSIGYDELPSGVYTLTLVLKQGEQELLRELRPIVNTSQFALPVNSFDYRVDAGVFEEWDSNDDASRLRDAPSGDRGYGRASLSYRPVETWLLAAGVTSNVDDTFMQTGGYWVYGDSLSAQYNLGVFASGSQSHYGQVSVGPFSSSIRNVNMTDEPSSLTQYLYGEESSTDWSLGLSGSVLGGTGYASYFNYKTPDFQSDNVSMSWTRDALGGLFSASTTYSIDDEQRDSWSTTLAWTYSFGDNVSARTGLYLDKEGVAYNQNSVTYQRSGDYGYASSTVGVKRGRESNAEWSANLSGQQDKFGYSAYTYMSTDGEQSLSGSLSGSQMLSLQGGAMTHQNGRTFVEIAPKSSEPESSSVDVTYDVLNDGEYLYRDSASLEEAKVVRLNAYTDVAFKLNADVDNVDIEGGDYHNFVVPGTFYQLNSTVIPLMSQVFLLNDMFGEPIPSVRCLGDSCKSVETLSDDGVFRVNFRKNEPFKLVSAKRLCVYNPELMGETYVQAYCLPGLDEVDGNVVWEDKIDLIDQSDTERALLYIGKYESTNEASHILKRLQEVGLAPKSIEVGDNMYVYVRYLKQYSIAQRDVLESLDAYVVLDSINANQLFSVR